MKNGKIQSFTDLNVWKEGHKLVIMIYNITRRFPKEETYSLVDQMRRAAASVTANIAEGFGRQYYKEKVQFYYLAKGSLLEIKNFILIAQDIKYLAPEQFRKLADQANIVDQLLQGLIKKSKTFINHQSSIINHRGFTLIEVLVTIGVLSLISGVVADTFFTVYRNSQKANITSQAKQSGEQILSIFEKSVRDSSRVEVECLAGSTVLTDCSLTTRNIIKFKITKKPQSYTEIGCVYGTVNTNGYIYQKLSSASSSGLFLTNNYLDTGVTVTNCDFSLTNKVARIAFVINESISAPARLEFKTSSPFELTVVLRN